MIWQNKCGKIVMLTNLVEETKVRKYIKYLFLNQCASLTYLVINSARLQLGVGNVV